MGMANLRAFWMSKKWVAFAMAFVIAVGTYLLNAKFGLEIQTNAIYALIGLNTLYIFIQGRIDSKKTNQAVGKAFFDSHKAVALLFGNLIPLAVGILNVKAGIEIPPNIVLGLLGVDGVYLLGKGAADAKKPDEH